LDVLVTNILVFMPILQLKTIKKGDTLLLSWIEQLQLKEIIYRMKYLKWLLSSNTTTM